MSQKLPIGGFEWMDFSIEEVKKLPVDADVGWFLEVDLEYPQSIFY